MLQERIDHDHVVKGYELREQIGEGGYGVVYRAYQPLVGRDVAVKIILPQYANHPDFIRRFEWEAQLVARLEHPYIVPLYDYWRDPDGAILVMRWLRGGNLHTLLHDRPLPTELLGRLIEQVGSALASAHRRGVVHRDLKPANILLDEEGNAYLADFGIAKDLGARVSPYQTDASMVVGSPAYISPEQVRAEPITFQTDIYSLGVMLYEILTGQLPFRAPTPIALMFMHVNEPVPTVRTQRPDLSDAVNMVIQKATAKRPTDRYSDVTTLIQELRQALASGPAVTGRLTDALPTPSQPESGNRTTSGTSTRSKYETGVLYLPVPLAEPIETEIANPYKGLRAFQEADADDFFGRELLTQLLLARMQEQVPLGRFLAVVGPSGSGKSSVVRAGLVPALRRGRLPGSQNWFVVEMFPGAHPIEELAQALMHVAVEPPNNLVGPLTLDDQGLLRVVDQVVPGADETEVVLVIDQFEEVFTLVEDEAARTHFLNSLINAVTDPYSRVRVILTLRADFYDRPLLYPGFSELMRQRTEVVVPLAPEELKQAIISPAERHGLRVDPELVEAIVGDVAEQPGALPLLQYALTEVFERRTGRTLTLTPYNASGGVLGALARRAEEIYTGLRAEQQEAARQLFLRLVTLGEGVEDTRRRVRRTELAFINHREHKAHGAKTTGSAPAIAEKAALDEVIDTYSQYRLLTRDNDPATRAPTVEVAHEALIRTWTRLRQWLDASRDDLRLQRRMTTAAAEWAASGHDRSFLASGARLEQLASWADETHLALNAEERDYLGASLAERDAQYVQEAIRKAHESTLERRSRTFLRALVGVALVAALLGIGLSVYAFGQRREALEKQGLAVQSANIAATAEAKAKAAAEDAGAQKVIAQQSAADAKSFAAAQHNQVLSSASEAQLSQGNTDQALALAMAANSIEPATLDEDRVLAEAAYASGTRLRLVGHKGGVQDAAFSRDGRLALSASDDKTLILWDLTTGQRVKTLTGHKDKVNAVAFSPDGKRALSASHDDTVILWDIGTGQLLRTLKGHDRDVLAVVFSPDGTQALSASRDTTLILWNLDTGKPIRTFKGHTQAVLDVVFSPDGKTALSASQDTTLMLWDVATAQIIRRFEGHRRDVNSVVFSPDGKTALSGSTDTTAILWDVETGRAIRTLQGRHTGEVVDVAFSPDGKLALTGSADTTIGLWDTDTGLLRHVFQGHGSDVRSVAFSPDGRMILSGSMDRSIRLWDLDNGAIIHRFVGHRDNVNSVALSRDGKIALTGGADNTMILWNLTTGQQIAPLLGHNNSVSSVAMSPDGKHALSGSADGTMILWDLDARTALHTFTGHTKDKDVSAVAYSPDGKTAVSGSVDTTIILWDLAAERPIRTLKGHTDKVNSLVFSSDGKTILSASRDATMILWDVATASPIRIFKGHTAGVRSAKFSPDGTKVLSGSEDNTMILWDTVTAKPIRRFVEHNAKVWDVAFSPDGKRALSGSADGSMILWDVETGQAMRRYSGHRAGVKTVAFTPDGRMALSSSNDTTLVLWRIDTRDDLSAWIDANRYIPPLTCDQEQFYNLELKHCT